MQKSDNKRFQKSQFGHDLYADLGSYFYEYLLPKLIEVSKFINDNRPGPVTQLLRVIQGMIIFGILIPFFASIDLLPVVFTYLSAACVEIILVYVVLMLGKVLYNELEFKGSQQELEGLYSQ